MEKALRKEVGVWLSVWIWDHWQGWQGMRGGEAGEGQPSRESAEGRHLGPGIAVVTECAWSSSTLRSSFVSATDLRVMIAVLSYKIAAGIR